MNCNALPRQTVVCIVEISRRHKLSFTREKPALVFSDTVVTSDLKTFAVQAAFRLLHTIYTSNLFKWKTQNHRFNTSKPVNFSVSRNNRILKQKLFLITNERVLPRIRKE